MCTSHLKQYHINTYCQKNLCPVSPTNTRKQQTKVMASWSENPSTQAWMHIHMQALTDGWTSQKHNASGPTYMTG